MSDKHGPILSLTDKNDKKSNNDNRAFRNKGVDPILSCISPQKQTNHTKISTIAESIARSLLVNDQPTKKESADDYSEEEEIQQNDIIKESKKKAKDCIVLNEKEQNKSNENDESKEESNFSVENTIHNKDNDSSLYDYIEEEEDIDEEELLLQEIKLQKEKENEKRKKEEEEENEINEKISLLNIEIIQPNKEEEKCENSTEKFSENESNQSKYEIIEEEPEKIEIKDEIDLKPKELFASFQNKHDLYSSSSSSSSSLVTPTQSPNASPNKSPNKSSTLNASSKSSTLNASSKSSMLNASSPNKSIQASSATSPSKNSNNKKMPKQQGIQHKSIFDFTSPKYDLKTPDIQSLKQSLKPKRKRKPQVINVNEISDQETFRKYLNGEFDSPKPQKFNYMYYYKQRRHYDTYLSHQEVIDICEKLIATPIGKNKFKFENPGDISLIIDELKRLKVESITNGEYSRSKKIDDVINFLRTQYRTLDREMFHKASLQNLERKIDDIKNQIVEMHGKIKEEDQQENEKFKENLVELGIKHSNQLQDLENTWKGPQKAREFNKRSATLLNGQYIERNLALIGEYDEAHAVHKINKRNEKIEAKTKHQVLNNSFENARIMMLTEQDKEKERVIKLQNDEKNYKKSVQKKNLEILQKRKAVLEIQLEDESSIDNFVAKKFRKDKSTVIPMSIILNGSDELNSNTPETARDVENLNNFIATPITSPLPLPPLTISQLKTKKKKSTRKSTL